MTTPRFPHGLYGITPDWDDTPRLLTAITQAHEGGMRVLQWRRKHGTPQDRRQQAREVQALCRDLGLMLIINDDWRLAADLDTDGVHMGRDDGAIPQARLALGSEKIIGCSCYNDPALAARHLREDIDYIAFGAMYPSHVKPDAEHATLDDLRAGRRLADAHPNDIAVVAIGGITPQNTPALIAAGADSVSVISALFNAPDIRAAAQAFSTLFP